VAPDAFGALADLLPEAMLLVAGHGRIERANRSAAALLGVGGRGLEGRPLQAIVDDEAAALVAFLRACSRSRAFVPGSLTFLPAEGPPVPCRCEGALLEPRHESTPASLLLRLTAKAAAPSQFVALNQRIDELSREVVRRRAAEASLEALSSRLRVTLESIGDAVIATDSAGRLRLMNPVAQRLTGWSLDEASGRPLEEVFVIVNEHTREAVESPVARVLREGGIVGLANHTVLIGKDGVERPIDDSGAPIVDDAGALIGVVLVFHDITERRVLEREIQRKAESLEQADRRKDEFLSMLAHELRNPLAPLATGAYLLERLPEASEGIRKTAAMMQRQAGHMTRLIDDLLDVARLTRGSIELRRAPVDLREVLNQAAEMTRPIIEAGKHRLEMQLGAAPLPVDADSTRLVQVFSNLLTNAAKYMAPGGLISVGTAAEAGTVSVAVRDSGPGIPPDLLPHVFDVFVQGKRSLARSQGGLGIGLTVVKSVTEMHGGEVAAHNNSPEPGATVVVRLPLLGPASTAQAPEAAAAPAFAPGPAAARILVVDDNIDGAESLAAVLREWGHVVVVSTEASSALALYDRTEPDVVLLDIGLPGIDGYELARHIRARARAGAPRAKLLAVTGYAGEGASKLSREAGFDAHLVKPVDLMALRAML
jgi:PAS domain S-box-containing protein